MIEPDVFGFPLRRSRKGHRKLRVGDERVLARRYFSTRRVD